MLEIILLIALSFFSPEKEIDVRLLENEGRTAAVVTLANTHGADDAIVTIGYWAKIESISKQQPILLSDVFVMPALANVGTMAGEVPARMTDIRSVKVVLVRRMGMREVPFTMTPPKP